MHHKALVQTKKNNNCRALSSCVAHRISPERKTCHLECHPDAAFPFASLFYGYCSLVSVPEVHFQVMAGKYRVSTTCNIFKELSVKGIKEIVPNQVQTDTYKLELFFYIND